MYLPLEELKEEMQTLRGSIAELKELIQKGQSQTDAKMLSVKEMATKVGVSDLTIRNWIKEGKIKAKKCGRRILIDARDFDNNLDEVKSLKYKR